MKKKLFALFSLLALVASCSQDAEITPSTQEGGGNAVNFSASMLSLSLSRAAEPKTTWDQGDQIAIFVDNDHTTAYCYDIDSAGTMTPAEGVEPFITMATDPTQTTYLAFYPYNAEFSSAEEYQAASSEEVDMMSSIASGATAVEFTFSHDAALLYFEFVINQDVLAVTVTNGQASYELDFTVDQITVSSSIFVEPADDISDAMLKITTDSKSYYYSLSADFEAWSQGCSYSYSNLRIDMPLGSGTEDDPFMIYIAADLRQMGTDTDGWSLSAHYKLGSNIDLGGIDQTGAVVEANIWSSVGTESSPFAGSFDGGGYVISGLYVNDSDNKYQGLFGHALEATIKNLGVKGNFTGFYYVGGIVGYNKKTSITSCYSFSTITATSYAGGIAGLNDGNTIESCYSVSYVTASNSSHWGGIIGYHAASSYLSYTYYNSDYLSGTTVYGVKNYGTVTNSSSKTSEEMREADFVTLLNTPLSEAVWVQDTEGVNDGYPILKL